MRVKSVLSLLTLIILFSCTKDDICAPDQAVTPNLIVVFKDIVDRDVDKAVQTLTVTTFNEETMEELVLLSNQSTDSIAIPLNTRADMVTYNFTRNTDNDGDGTSEIMTTDTFIFNYTRDDIYLNRACAFITNYNNFEADDDFTSDGENWILDFDQNQTTVVDELQAHITIFH